ncbi:FecR family protein [Zunongwangia sp. HGR-M22]|uniref:FecR family protein n=1 Tax=Zunongwangia sp. HGR-M22 TaxID=3015168 RepID=UPI0022DDF6A7|nr:FecR family protein [Zunongwangia sp. HGR-M22]WBL26717.1 FecR family protein [Zunongwangia sp. HGR-M22]
MNKNARFTYLLEKYLNNSCSREEFDEFFELLQDPACANYLKESELSDHLLEEKRNNTISKETSEIVFQNILKHAHKEKVFRKRWTRRKIFSAAAIFIGLFIGGSLWNQWKNENNTSNSFSSEHVVLEQQNGEQLILDTLKSTKIISSAGDTIRITQGNLIRYDKNSKILGNNTIRVPFGKTFQVALSDGSIVHLNSGSSLTYPINFSKSEERMVELKGEAFFDIAHDVQKPFIVKTDELNVQVLGTKFDINAYQENKNIAVALLEGAVKMFNQQNNTDEYAKILSPGFVGNYSKEDKGIQTKEDNVQNYVAWRFDNLVYRNVEVKHLLTKLERHFNIQIDNNYKEIESKTLNANFGDQPIDEVMKYLSEIYGFKYTINNNLVTIKEK